MRASDPGRGPSHRGRLSACQTAAPTASRAQRSIRRSSARVRRRARSSADRERTATFKRAASPSIVERDDPQIPVHANWEIPVAHLDSCDANVVLHGHRLPGHREDLVSALALGLPERSDRRPTANHGRERRRAVGCSRRKQLAEHGGARRTPGPLVTIDPARQGLVVHRSTVGRLLTQDPEGPPLARVSVAQCQPVNPADMDRLCLRDGNVVGQVNVLDCVEDLDALIHGPLEHFASADQAGAACALVDHRGADGLGEVGFT